MAAFDRAAYKRVYYFARSQYYWHESTGRGHDMMAALLMEMCEEVLGQMNDFPIEARKRLQETPKKVRARILLEMEGPDA